MEKNGTKEIDGHTVNVWKYTDEEKVINKKKLEEIRAKTKAALQKMQDKVKMLKDK